MSNPYVTSPPLAASAANASSKVYRSLPGGLDFIQANTSGTAGWFLLFDATAEGADGACTPVLAWQVAANTTLDRGFDPPLYAANGWVLTFSTTGPTTQTKSATAWFGGRIT